MATLVDFEGRNKEHKREYKWKGNFVLTRLLKGVERLVKEMLWKMYSTYDFSRVSGVSFCDALLLLILNAKRNVKKSRSLRPDIKIQSVGKFT